MRIANSFELLNSICQRWKLPASVFSIEIELNVDEAPVAFVGIRITEEAGAALGEILEDYELRLRDNPNTIPSVAVSAFTVQDAADEIERDRESKAHR